MKKIQLFVCAILFILLSNLSYAQNKGEFLGFSMIEIGENGKVALSNEIYESDLEKISGIPIYRYIKNENDIIVQIKAYKVDSLGRSYIIDYVINVDRSGNMVMRAVLETKDYVSVIDYIEYYNNGSLERIEHYEEGKILSVIERFDESGTYITYLGKEEVVYLDPYNYYNTYVYTDTGDIDRFGVYHPNNELLLRENYVRSGTVSGEDMVIVYDKDTRTRIIKILNEDGNPIKEEYYDDMYNLVFYKEYKYDTFGNYTQISIIENQKEVKTIFYYKKGNIVKREKYINNELISTVNYN